MAKRKSNIIETAMRHQGILRLLLFALIIFGAFALYDMPKNEFPVFTVRQGVVAAVYPGANVHEVEEQVTKPLETFLWGFKEIKKSATRSVTKDGIVYIFVELNDNISSKDEFWSKFKIRLQQFKIKLPAGVLALIANDDFGDTSAMLITLESRDKSYRQLRDYMQTLQEKLRVIPEIANLRLYGAQEEQISVYIDKDKLTRYGVNTATLMASLTAEGMTIPSGTIDDEKQSRPIHLTTNIKTENDLAQKIVFYDPAGHVIRLRDIATIRREYPKAEKFICNNGKKCLVLSVEMEEGHNIVKFGKEVGEIIDNFKQTLPEEVTVYPITDQSQVVSHSVLDFLQELLIAIISVIIVIMLLLPFRVSGVAATTIPITVFVTLGMFFVFGIELNTVTLAALMCSLGMIVDNSIVIIDGYVELIDKGRNRWHAASLSARLFWHSVFSATLAISVTFFPLIFTMKGVLKDFVKWFPISISIVLGTSLLVALFVVPVMQYTWVKKGLALKSASQGKPTFLDRIQSRYDRLVNRCFAHPIITLGVGLAGIIVGVILFTMLPQRLMPGAERNQFAVEIYLPEGTSIEQTQVVADSLRDMMMHDKDIQNITTFYGCSSPRFQTTYAPQIGGSNYAQFIVNTAGNKQTERLIKKLEPLYADYFGNAMIRIKQLDYNIALSPFEIRFSGDDLNQLRTVVDSAMARLRKMPSLTMLRTTEDGMKAGIDIRLDEYEMGRLGLSKSVVAANLATRFAQGIPLTTIWENDYPVKVMLRDRNTQNQTLSDLNNTLINGLVPTAAVPLRQVAKIKPDWNHATINRRNGVRNISIMADVVHGHNLNAVTDQALDKLKSIELPDGVTMTTGGQRENDNETKPQIFGGLLIAICIIFIILILHFRNVKLSSLVMLTLLFALPGAAIGVLIMRQEVGLTGILGIISLMGIIVRNGIIMIDYAEELRIKRHMTPKKAAMCAAKRRMRPIFLTSAAASVGVIPMVIKNSPLWGPMGVIICFGTILSTLFIITVLPIGYRMLYRRKDKRRIAQKRRVQNNRNAIIQT